MHRMNRGLWIVVALVVVLAFGVAPLAHAAATVITVIDFAPSRAGNIAANTTTNKVYAAKEDTNEITAINGSTNAVVGSVSTSGFHTGLSVNPVTNRIYVSQQFANVVKVIDGSSDTSIADIPIPSIQTIAFNAVDTGFNRLYVVRPNNGDIIVVDAATNTVGSPILAGCCSGPTALAVDSATHRLYVVSPGTSNLLVVDGANPAFPILATVPLPSDGARVAIHPTTKMLYVTHSSSASVSVMDGVAGSPTENTIVATIPVGTSPVALTIDPIINRLYVSNTSAQTLSIISLATNAVVDTVSGTPNGVGAIAALPALHRIYVPDDGLKGVSVVDDPRGSLSLVHSPAHEFVGDTFTVDIVADAKTLLVDTVDAYVDFDPAVMEVVTAGGALTNTIELNTLAFPSATVNTVDNALGKINFSASRTSAPFLTGSQTVATIRFRGKGTSSGATSVTLVRSGARQSDLLRAGNSVAETFANASFPVYPKSTLNGRVRPDRRGPEGTARWITELFRNPTPGAGVKVFTAGTSTLVGSFQATTNNTGQFSVLLTGLIPGTYDFVIKPSNALSVIKPNVVMPSATEVDFGSFQVGDSNADDIVNGGDVSYMVPSFVLCTGQPPFDAYADANADGCVNGADVSSLVPNFGHVGPTDGTLPTVAQGTGGLGARSGAASGTGISIVPTNASLKVGETTTVTVRVNAGSGVTDTVDAYIKVDPQLLEIVPSGGNGAGIAVASQAFSSATLNRVDVAGGRIDFSATRLDRSRLSGTVDVGTFTVRARAAGTATVDLVRSGGRQSDLFANGTGLSAALGNVTIVISPVRVAVGVSASSVAAQGGGLRVTLTAGCGTIRQVKIGNTGQLANASVDVEGGPSGITSATTYTPPTPVSSLVLIVHRVTAGVATTVPLAVTDDCGVFHTFVGGGPNAGF